MGDFADVDGIVDVLKMKEEIKQLKERPSKLQYENLDEYARGKCIELEICQQQLEEANTVIKIYSNPNDMYYVDKVVKVAGKEVFYIKDIQQIAMLGKEYLNKFGEQHENKVR